jgi:chitinase
MALTGEHKINTNQGTKLFTAIFLFRYLDFINIMTYDMHGSWDSVTGHSAPLYPGTVDDGFTVVSKNYRPNATLSHTAHSTDT